MPERRDIPIVWVTIPQEYLSCLTEVENKRLAEALTTFEALFDKHMWSRDFLTENVMHKFYFKRDVENILPFPLFTEESNNTFKPV